MKSNSFRVRESLARLLWQDRTSRRSVSGSSVRFQPRVEQLEQRRLLAVATDLATIGGRVFDDLTGNGYDPGEEVAGAEVTLYRDDGDGIFEPGSEDTVVKTVFSDAAGLYEFTRRTEGDYFVLQPEQTVTGQTLQQSVSPLITIDADAAQGRIVLSIDSFDTTEQSVRDETNDGVPVTSSVAAPEAIGGERDLFVNKTSETGAVQLSVNDPLLPDLLSFDSLQFGDGIRRVVWDGVDGDAATIDDSGLAATDLTSGDEAEGVRLQIGARLLPT